MWAGGGGRGRTERPQLWQLGGRERGGGGPSRMCSNRRCMGSGVGLGVGERAVGGRGGRGGVCWR